jgi:hypothetical protein
MPFQRGAPKGNTNRLRHGNYSRTRKQRRAEVRSEIRKLKNLVIKATLVLHARRALRLKNTRRACCSPLTSPLWGGRFSRSEKRVGAGAQRAPKKTKAEQYAKMSKILYANLASPTRSSRSFGASKNDLPARGR